MRAIRLRTIPCAGALAGLMLGGCAWHDPERLEADFGESVRQMVREQIHDPAAAYAPAEFAPDFIDGGESVLGVDGYLEAARQARRLDRETVPETGRISVQ